MPPWDWSRAGCSYNSFIDFAILHASQWVYHSLSVCPTPDTVCPASSLGFRKPLGCESPCAGSLVGVDTPLLDAHHGEDAVSSAETRTLGNKAEQPSSSREEGPQLLLRRRVRQPFPCEPVCVSRLSPCGIFWFPSLLLALSTLLHVYWAFYYFLNAISSLLPILLMCHISPLLVCGSLKADY